MEYKSNVSQVMAAMKLCKHEFCQDVGDLVKGEAQNICPIGHRPQDTHPGNLKKSIDYEVMPGDEGVTVGVTDAAKYGINVEKGIGQHAQPYLEPGAMNSLSQIRNVAEKLYKSKLGGE
jgi:hypothetical protein